MPMLKPRYEQFCRHYIETGSGYEAAIGAGYSRRSAYTTGCRLIGRAEIIARLQELRRQIAERESLNSPALLMKLENAYVLAVEAKNPLAIVRVIELQAKIAGLAGTKRGAASADDEIAREIAALDAEPRPQPVPPRPRKTIRQPPPAAAASVEPVLMPVAGHDEPALNAASGVASHDAQGDTPTPDEEQRRQHVRRLALEAVARARTRQRLRLRT